jgi:Ca2+/Na+ antiporter
MLLEIFQVAFDRHTLQLALIVIFFCYTLTFRKLKAQQTSAFVVLHGCCCWIFFSLLTNRKHENEISENFIHKNQ